MSANRPRASSGGLLSQLRSQHWGVRLILVFVVLFFGSPLIAVAVSGAFSAAGGFGALVVLGSIAAASVWFLFVPQSAAVAGVDVSRYCGSCGTEVTAAACSNCGAPWAGALADDSPAGLARVLNLMGAEYEADRLDAKSFVRIRDEYTVRLRSALRAVEAAPSAEVPPVAPDVRVRLDAAPVSPAVLPGPPAPPRRSSRELGEIAIGWAAVRQADILLYVGAFLLSVSAIIFVAVQGESVSGVVRFSILSIYALVFLGLGLALHRWERLKEAGPVFLALGAVLVPVDLLALRTQVLGQDQVANDVLWFLGSSLCSALYFSLSARGYGRLYALPGIPASLVAWGSLASIVNLPIEWYGPWFAAVGASGYVVATILRGRWEAAKWLLGLSVVVGATALLFTQLAVWITGDQPAALPAAYLIGTAAVVAGLYWRRDVPALVALPALAALSAGSGWWASFGLTVEWRAPFVVGAAAGYLVVAYFRGEAEARRWALFGAVAGIAGLGLAHISVAAAAEAQRGALPVSYALAFVAAAGAFGRWRWAEPGALLPPLAVMVVATTQWAAGDVNVEWYGAFAGVAPLGYLALAAFDRPGRTERWQLAAAVSACVGPVMAHAALDGNSDRDRWALTAAYLPTVVGAGLAFLRWRWAWRLAPAALPALVAMTALSFGWAAWDLQREWFPAFAAGAGLGYLLLAQFDDEKFARKWASLAALAAVLGLATVHGLFIAGGAASAALPTTYGIVLVGVVASFARWRWTEAAAALPPITAATALTALWASIALEVEWYGSFAAAAALGYLLLAWFDRPGRVSAWQAASIAAGLIGLAVAHAAVGNEASPQRLPLPVTYGVLLAGWTALAIALRDRSLLLPPVLVSALGATALWAADVEPVWWAYPALGVAAVMMAANRWWRGNPVLGASGWLYAVVLVTAATVAVLPVDYSHPAHGVAVQLVAAGLLLFASFRSGGSIARVVLGRAPGARAVVEWTVLTQASFAFLFGAGASLNGVLQLTGPDRAWVLLVPAMTGWALAAAGVRGRAGLRTFAPVGMTGMTVATIVAAPSDAIVTAVLVLATVGPLAAFAGTRRWMFLGIANSTLLLVVWTAWRWQEFEIALIPLAFAAVATLEWGALTTFRRYTARPGESDLAITYISWAPWLLSAAVSGLLLSQKQQHLPAGGSLVRTQEWGLAAAVLGLASAAVAAEGLRLARRWIWIPGTAGMLVALLMAIATREPENVQAYSVPIAVYLIAATLTFKVSPRVIGDQMCVHEALMVVGALVLVLPPAEQSFGPGGGKFGLELLGIGLGLLAVGLLLHARWLVPAAVTTLTATALRMVTGGLFSTPYWLLFGIAGTLLLLLGMLVLLERERWDRFRLAVVEWWRVASQPEPPEPGAPASRGP